MGAGNLSQCETENIVALCDVDQKQVPQVNYILKLNYIVITG